MPPLRVIAVASNKGGVGKSTLATNLPVYARALHEDLPILVLGLDDQDLIEKMFALEGAPPGPTILEALRDRDLVPAIRLGQYGVHYVPPSAEISDRTAGLSDPFALRQLLERSGWGGLVVIDTKSDLGILTQSALAASDLVLLPVSDRASLDQAERIYALLDAWKRPRERARVVLTLVDRRVKYRSGDEADILALLVSEAQRRGFPLFESFVSRSPKIESLTTNPEGRAHSILHGARGSLIHRQLAHLTEDALRRLEELGPLAPAAAPGAVPTAAAPPAAERRLWSVEALLGPASAAQPSGKGVRSRAPYTVRRASEPAKEAERRDRRRLARRAFDRRLSAFRVEDPPIVALRGRDLSLDGIGVDPAPELGVGARVHVALPRGSGAEPLLLWARVVRSERSGTGLRFETPTDARDRERLGSLLSGLAPVAAGSAPGEERASG